MCLILFAYRAHPDFPLVIAANRDEYYERPTRIAHFWEDAPNLLAGRDLQGGGTWMGINKRGRFAAVTNYREPRDPPENAISRGRLCTDFLLSDISVDAYLNSLSSQGNCYPGFNLITGDFSTLGRGSSDDLSLGYFSNRLPEPTMQTLSPGIHGVSNGLLNEHWPKVESGKSALAEQLQHPLPEILELLLDTQTAADEELPDTGIEKSREKQFSSRFIKTDNYGTRTSSVIRIDARGRVEWLEQNFGPYGNPGARQSIDFSLD